MKFKMPPPEIPENEIKRLSIIAILDKMGEIKVIRSKTPMGKIEFATLILELEGALNKLKQAYFEGQVEISQQQK
jgi:hypothetical protein